MNQKIPLRIAREQRGLTQRQLAAMAAISPGTLCRVEYDIVVPLAPTRARIAAALNLDVTSIAWPEEATCAIKPRHLGPWRLVAAQRRAASDAH